MRKFITVFILAFLFACSDPNGTVELSGEADLNVQENFTECYVRQSANSLIVNQSGADEFIFIFDPSVIYPNEYITLTEADALRITPYTANEQLILDGAL